MYFQSSFFWLIFCVIFHFLNSCLQLGWFSLATESESESRAYGLHVMKIENRSCKPNHKLNGIGVGRIRTFPFLPNPFTTLSHTIEWKLGHRSRKQTWKNQPIERPEIEHCHWFILPLLLAPPTMQFSLDRKQWSHKQNQCSASDSVGLIFTRSYCSTLLSMTPSTTL